MCVTVVVVRGSITGSATERDRCMFGDSGFVGEGGAEVVVVQL